MKNICKLIVGFGVILAITSNAYSHGGGCRKDSPKGKCCHAGSKPYHCH